jgi:2'-5' RNA ligase
MRFQPLFRARWRDARAALRQDASYRRIWQSFRQFREVEDGRHDTDAWRAQDGIFAGCIVRVPAEALKPALDELRDALRPTPFVRLHPDHFLHIMLQEIGFVCAEPKHRNEWSADRLDEFVTAATAAVAEAPSFDLRLGGANAFQDAVFLDAHDRGACARLHTRLHELAALSTVSRFAYLPHSTVAHFTDRQPIGNLPAIIAQFRDRRFGTFRVSQVHVATLRLDEPYPALETHAVLPLAES